MATKMNYTQDGRRDTSSSRCETKGNCLSPMPGEGVRATR